MQATSFGPATNLSAVPSAGCPYPSMSPMMSGPFNPQGNVQPGLAGYGPSLPMSSGGICSGPRGVMPGGGLTQSSKLQQIAELVGGLDANQTRTLQQMLGERLDSQTRMTPEFFGDVPRNERSPVGFGGFGDAAVRLPGVPESDYEGSHHRDVFAKTEKWLSPAPVPEVSTWTNRELEIVGFNEYVTQLASWAAQASLEFSNEILQASRWSVSISCGTLTVVQKNRASRLLAILRAAFSTHPRTSMLVSAYMEGINLHRMVGSDEETLLNSQGANGFELLRQLTHEYSLRSRAEALSLRASLATKSFVLSGAETTTMTVVSDIIRRVDLEAAKYAKLVATLPMGIDSTGLAIPEADLLLILLRSLPETVRNYCLHHSAGDSYMAFRETARRWETQQRLFHETYGSQTQGKKHVHQVTDETKGNAEWFSMDDPNLEPEVNAVSGDKCSKCGSKKHRSDACTGDLSKIKCFSCGGSGHIGANCPQERKGGNVNQGDKWMKGKGDGKGKGGKSGKNGKGNDANKGKGKGKSKGYGKKGKLNEAVESDPSDMWYEDSDWWFDADWNTWVTSAVHDSWCDQENYQGKSWNGDSAQADGTEQNANSWIISMMQGVADDFGETGLFLEGSGSDGSCLTLGSSRCSPQRFLEGSCSGKGSKRRCNSALCGCPECVVEGKKFSQAWSTHRMRLNEKSSK